MRLVDLLLLPRQQSYGVSSNDSHYRHPLGAAYLRSKNSEELKSNRKNLDFYRRQDSALCHQPAPEKSFRSSTGSLSDLLRSKKSPTSPGYWNHPTVNPSPSSATGETLRLAQLINGFVKQESDETGGFTTTAVAARGCFDVCSDDRQPLPTMDKTLNGNIWNREEFSPSSSSSSYSTKFFPSLSSSSSSSSPSSSASSLSSLGLDDRASFNRRRISFLSSDGSELEPEPLLQSLATDSDGYESLSSSPLEAVDSAAAAAAAAGAFRWMEEHTAGDSAIGYLDWHGGGGGGEGEAERGGYDIEACPLFNFNFLENTLDDCPFESFDTKDTIPRYDSSSFCDSPMVSMVPDVMATEALKSCGSFSDRDDVQSSFRGHLFKLNELDRRTRHGLKSNDGSDLPDFPPSSSVTAVPGIPAAPVSSTETLQQSEVVKLLLQNRHQWAIPQEKLPSPPATGCRGSRKRASAATNGRDVGRAKVARETRSYNDVPNSNEEISLSFAPFVRTNSFSASGVDGQEKCDHSSSLEKLITELMLFESSTKSDSEGDFGRNSSSSSSETSATSALPYVELFTPALHPSELFDGLAACRISDTELFSSLDLESVYLSDCEPFSSALGDGLDFENAKSFEAFVKTEPEKAPFLSLPPSPSLCPPPDSFGRPGNWLSGADSRSSRNDGRSSSAADHKSSVLERILQTNLLFDSLDCDAKLLVAGGRGGGGGFVSDHDYCQNLEVLSLNDGALDLTCDQNLRNERRRRTELSPGSCYSRKRDYSALKSLLLDSNLTEEVRKEVELDRAKSRKKMSEKLKVTSVNDPARLQRLGKIRDDRILKQHLENYDPYCDVDRANSETTEGSCQQEKCASIDAQSGIATGRYSPAVEISRRDFDSGTAQPELPAEDSSGSGADDNNTLVTSDLELSGGDDEAVFFNSFEDFYSKNQSELESSNRQSNASNHDENDDPTKNQDSPTEFEPKVKRNKRKSAIGKRVRVHRSVGRSGSKVARNPMRRPPTVTKRPLIRTGTGRSVDHRRRKLSNSTPHLRAKSPPISNNRSSL